MKISETLKKDIELFFKENKIEDKLEIFIVNFHLNKYLTSINNVLFVYYFLEFLLYNAEYIPFNIFLEAYKNKKTIKNLPPVFYNFLLLNSKSKNLVSFSEFFVLIKNANFRNNYLHNIKESFMKNIAENIPKGTKVLISKTHSEDITVVLQEDINTNTRIVNYLEDGVAKKIHINSIEKISIIETSPKLMKQELKSNSRENYEFEIYKSAVSELYDTLREFKDKIDNSVNSLQNISLEEMPNKEIANLIENSVAILIEKLENLLKILNEPDNIPSVKLISILEKAESLLKEFDNLGI